jgi:putative ABC transport system permease protein
MLLQEIRFGIRSLVKSPGFAVVAVITLALGIGANTAMFSIVNAVLLRPLPYDEPDQLVWMSEFGDEVANRWVSYPNFVDWSERNRSFETMSTFRGWSVSLTSSEGSESLDARMVSAGYFKVMRASPMLGRDFTPEDDQPGANPVTILSYRFWQQRFGGDPNIVGKTITLEDRPYTVVGVMKPGFAHQGPPPLWLLVGPQNWKERDVRTAGNVIARLKPGVTQAQARAEMNTISRQLFEQYPVHNAGGYHVRLLSLQESITGKVSSALLILFGAVGLVLMIACANVANLLLARAATRRREFAIKAALGAGRGRIVRQLLVESILLALVGGTLGLLLASLSMELIAKTAHSTVPRLEGLQLNYLVFGFNLLLSALTGLVFGLAPAWRSTKGELHQALKDGSATTTAEHGKRMRSALVVAEVALSVTLLVGAGLLIKSMLLLLRSDVGFDPRNVLTMELRGSRTRHSDRPQLNRLQQQILERVAALPGIKSVSLSANLPGFTDGWQSDIYAEGQPDNEPGQQINVDWSIVSEDYFETVRVPILRGRTFSREEVADGKPVVLVDQSLARRFWPNEEAVGKHIKYDSRVWHEIVGVVRDVGVYGSEAKPLIKIYTPWGRAPQRNAVLSVRLMQNDSYGTTAAITREIHALDTDLPVTEVATLEDLLAREVAPKRFNARLFSSFAAIALILAITGVYGVMSYTVAQRTHEVGIRMALGASQRDVLRLFIGQGMRLVLLGVAIGLAGALALNRVMTSLLFGVSSTDAATFATVSVGLTVVALVACYLPARRATKVDPLVALRYE